MPIRRQNADCPRDATASLRPAVVENEVPALTPAALKGPGRTGGLDPDGLKATGLTTFTAEPGRQRRMTLPLRAWNKVCV